MFFFCIYRASEDVERQHEEMERRIRSTHQSFEHTDTIVSKCRSDSLRNIQFCSVETSIFITEEHIQLHFSMVNAGSVFVTHIMKTCLYNFDPLKPHFYIVKLGFTGVYIIFLIFAQKHRLWVLVRTASLRQF